MHVHRNMPRFLSRGDESHMSHSLNYPVIERFTWWVNVEIHTEVRIFRDCYF